MRRKKEDGYLKHFGFANQLFYRCYGFRQFPHADLSAAPFGSRRNDYFAPIRSACLRTP